MVTTSCVVPGAVVVELAYTGVDEAGGVTTGEELDSGTVDEPSVATLELAGELSELVVAGTEVDAIGGVDSSGLDTGALLVGL